MSVVIVISVFVRAIVLSLLLVTLTACNHASYESVSKATTPAAASVQSAPIIAAITAAINSAGRWSGDADDDSWRKPQTVLEFADIKPGMQVLDYFAASGYYSELLSRVVGQSGSVIVYNNPQYAKFAGDKLTQRFAKQRLPNTKIVTAATDVFKPNGNSLDAILFVMSYHDLYWQPKGDAAPFGNPAEILPSLFQALKSGGVVVIVDHIANPGGEVAEVVSALHRIDPNVVKLNFAKAGFVFDGESNALRHNNDDHTKPVFDASVRHKTDQFIFRFRKPSQS